MARKSQKHLELEFTHAIQQDYTRLFHDVARALTSTLELEIVLTTVMTKMAQFFGPERWSMMLVDKEKNDLYYVIAVGEDSKSLRGLRVPMGEGVAGWVALTGNPMVVPDTSVEPRWQEFSRKNPGLNINSIACVPVRSADGVVGVIQLLNSKVDLLSDYSIQFLRVLCDFTAIAVRNAADMERIHLLSISDDCTGLFNARHLYTLLEERLKTQERAPFSLLFLDLDHFKSINDTHGHLVGSRLLAEVGDLIKRTIGPTIPAFRYGGDEFVCLLPDLGKSAGREVATKLFYALREARFLEVEGLSLELRGSFGMATYPDDARDIEGIIKAADDMMYYVKGTTRDNLAIAGLGSVLSPGTIEGEEGARAGNVVEPALGRDELLARSRHDSVRH
ncbi:diguanylate cyclase (GGDEF) domain-containing protein [Terriglobus roseus DSM 18391]|uniref:diguanylate cyclase n=1 Tax=Terriglobus roseus (strain DSM 18391 / NRRL B-41598 / KBS 63) TaxID=926566 RepID=I3ZK07_TERRK|nr:sensor domain-containing diguanylate cyclase [Terriglobus roseus]AFL89575.1 diguanylate cyclase (GGDEF) domain-containing protein [Terriglobus roseus DSM 18391]